MSRTFLLSFLLSRLTSLTLLCALAPAHASNDTEVTDVIALARLCVNESGIQADRLDDCAAIHAVICFRRNHLPAYQGLSYVDALHRYSHSVTIDRERTNRPWIADLWPDARVPSGWRHDRARWTGRHDRWWLESYHHAAAVYRGEILAKCQPHTWARSDVRPADPTARIIDCGNTINEFWAIPLYAELWNREADQ